MSLYNSTTVSIPRLQIKTIVLPYGLLIRLGICLMALSFSLYNSIEVQNKMTKLQIEIPQIVKEIQTIKEENQRLKLEIIRFESPEELINHALRPEFKHLRQPLAKDVLTIQVP